MWHYRSSSPDFVKNYKGWFEVEYGDRYAWSQLFGWGTGSFVNDGSFYWVAWTDSDSRLYIAINRDLSKKEIKEIEQIHFSFQFPSIPWKADTSELGSIIAADWIHFLVKSEKPSSEPGRLDPRLKTGILAVELPKLEATSFIVEMELAAILD